MDLSEILTSPPNELQIAGIRTILGELTARGAPLPDMCQIATQTFLSGNVSLAWKANTATLALGLDFLPNGTVVLSRAEAPPGIDFPEVSSLFWFVNGTDVAYPAAYDVLAALIKTIKDIPVSMDEALKSTAALSQQAKERLNRIFEGVEDKEEGGGECRV